jgi:hypothetical protein
MDFLSTPLPQSCGSEEKVEKRYIAWNKGTKGLQVAHNKGREHLSKEARARVTAANIGRKRSAESIAKQSLAAKGKIITSEHKKILSEKAKQRWQDPEWVAKKSTKSRTVSPEVKQKQSDVAKRRWANMTKQQRKRPKKNVKLFLTPYGKITMQEALEISGLSTQQIRGRIGRQTQGWGSTDEYIIVDNT